MKHDGNSELDLNKDQLQAITGGCQQCQQDLRQVDVHHDLIRQYTDAAAVARQQGNNALAQQHLDFATQHASQARNLMQAVANRHPVAPH